MRIDIIFSDLDGIPCCWGDKGLSTGGGPGPGGGAGISFVPATGRFQRHSPGGAGAALLAVRHCDERAVVWDRAEGRAIRRAGAVPRLAVRVMARLEDFPAPWTACGGQLRLDGG